MGVERRGQLSTVVSARVHKNMRITVEFSRKELTIHQ